MVCPYLRRFFPRYGSLGVRGEHLRYPGCVPVMVGAAARLLGMSRPYALAGARCVMLGPGSAAWEAIAASYIRTASLVQPVGQARTSRRVSIFSPQVEQRATGPLDLSLLAPVRCGLVHLPLP